MKTAALKTISSDYLIKLAKELKTSTDYILGLTPVSVPKSYDISELGLSNEAVKGLVTGTIDVGNPQPTAGTQEFSPVNPSDPGLLPRYGGEGDYGTEPAY